MYGVHHANATHQFNPALETFDIPQHDACDETDRSGDQHDELVSQSLHRVELVVRLNVVWAALSFEDAVAVIPRLPEEVAHKTLCIQYRMIVRDPIREEVITQPQKIVADHYESDPVVQLDGRFESHQVEKVDISELKPCQYQEYESKRIDPVPDAYWKRIDIRRFVMALVCLNRLHLGTPRYHLFLKYLPMVIWATGITSPPIRPRISRLSSNLTLVPPSV